jgi:hypothetical protein
VDLALAVDQGAVVDQAAAATCGVLAANRDAVNSRADRAQAQVQIAEPACAVDSAAPALVLAPVLALAQLAVEA